MSEKRGPRGRLEEQVEAAERFLVLRNFEEADRVSRYVMQKATSVPDSKNQLQRAASVLLQAMFELNRFGESLAVLQQQYGSPECVDLDVLMLWAALALDAHMQPEAAVALGDYLAKHASGAVQQPGAGRAAPQLSSQQFAMAAQMYAVEVLAREGGQHKQAVAWVQGEAAQRLGPAQGERMLAQLREVRGGAEGTPAQPGTPMGGPGRSPQPRFPDSPPNQAAPHGGTPAGGLDTHAACPSHLQPAAGQAIAQRGVLSSSLAEPGTGGSPSGAGATLPSRPGAARPAGATGGGKDWAGLGQAWSASARQRLAQLWQRVQSGEALGEWDQSQVAAAALGGAVLLYAAVAERRAVSQGLRRVGGGLVGSVWEVFRLATTLNPNPMAAAVAGQRYA